MNEWIYMGTLNYNVSILKGYMQLLEKQGLFNDKRESMCKNVSGKKWETNPAMKISSQWGRNKET